VSGSADRPRRILVTGAHTFWGGRVAQAFESDPDVEVIVGMGVRDPSVPLERTDFVRVQDQTYSTLSRIVSATQVDTIVHTGLIVDATVISSNSLQEHNVIATMNLLAAAGSPDSTVRSLIVKSSGLVYGASSRDPYAFSESMTRTGPPGTPMERSLLDAESLVRDFGRDHPEVRVSLLRFANVLGADLRTPLSRNLARRLCPGIFGYDPLLQFVEQEDVVRALVHAVRIDEAGTFNVGAPGRLPLSEVAAICGARIVPLPPWQTVLLSRPGARLGLFNLPPDLIPLLRYGRGLDTSRFAATGFRYRFSTLEATHAFARTLRLRKGAGTPATDYRYQEDVEHFLRHANSIAVRSSKPTPIAPARSD
jgi:UDP-glucose 4-epimerase